MTEGIKLTAMVDLKSLPIAETRTQGIPSISFNGYAIIKTSDYHKYREEFKLDERCVLIAPDSFWDELEVKLSIK